MRNFVVTFTIGIQSLNRRVCTPLWQRSSPGFFRSPSMHPDLAKLQCEQGALFSYREAQSNLEKLNYFHRSVNNHTQVKRITDKVGALLSESNLLPPIADECTPGTKTLIVQVDGGHIPIQEKDKRSFEALSAVAYRPESIQEVDKHHRQIVDKTCVISAVDDQLQTIKTCLVSAALKQGMTAETEVIALADGAKNCWSVISVVQPHCKKLESILDWFHIGKKFQQVKNALGEAFENSLDSVKWKLWHVQVEEALTKIELLKVNLTVEEKKSKLQRLYDYIKRNKQYIVNYEEREQNHQTYTSQVAESHFESVINARHKRSGRCNGLRKGHIMFYKLER